MRRNLLASLALGAWLAEPICAQPGYPGGYGGLGAYGGYGWNSYGWNYALAGSPFGYGYNVNSIPYGPYTNTSPFAPNLFNRASQPLSPYLNMFPNANPATNYYFRVRPGTMPMMPQPRGLGLAPGGQMLRPPLFPEQFGPDPLAEPDQPGRVLPPAGHPVVFNNTLGYFPGSGMGLGRTWPGTLGIGNPTPPRQQTRPR